MFDLVTFFIFESSLSNANSVAFTFCSFSAEPGNYALLNADAEVTKNFFFEVSYRFLSNGSKPK